MGNLHLKTLHDMKEISIKVFSQERGNTNPSKVICILEISRITNSLASANSTGSPAINTRGIS